MPLGSSANEKWLIHKSIKDVRCRDEVAFSSVPQENAGTDGVGLSELIHHNQLTDARQDVTGSSFDAIIDEASKMHAAA